MANIFEEIDRVLLCQKQALLLFYLDRFSLVRRKKWMDGWLDLCVCMDVDDETLMVCF
mgnify:CR=1 FL=1